MWLRRSGSGEPEARAADEGGYIASASDLMIGLLFVFIILVVVLALEQRRQQQAFDQQMASLDGAGDPLIAVTGAVGAAIEKVLPRVKVNPKTGVITLPEEVLFEVNSDQLSDEGRAALGRAQDALASSLRCFVENQREGLDCPGNPYGHEIETIFIEGHTDNRPFRQGAGRDNFGLSLARARAVDQVLVAAGPLEGYRNRAGQPVFSFSAYADTRPLPGTDPSAGENRRVDLRIVLSYKPIRELVPVLKQGAAR